MKFAELLPITAKEKTNGHIEIGGCDVVELADEFGTPLYIFDELTIRENIRVLKEEFGKRYENFFILYASKAFLNIPFAKLLREEGLGLDVVSGGELYVARKAGFEDEVIYFHGNNKTEEELKEAGGVNIVVDNFQEIELLSKLGHKKEVLIRISPAIDPHTHKYIATGVLDTKFGFPLAHAEEAAREVRRRFGLKGIHFHIGSMIPSPEPYVDAIKVSLDLAEKIFDEEFELNIGGGFPVRYTMDTSFPPISEFAEKIVDAIHKAHIKPRLIIEPGRAIVGNACVSVYRVGTIKEIPGVRKYVSVDGGMSDNIRPALYGSRYEAILASRKGEGEEEVRIAGKLCESGDILISEVKMPKLKPGDLILIPVSGAYQIPMASNYNQLRRPPIVMVRDGRARLIRRREEYEDLVRCDVDD